MPFQWMGKNKSFIEQKFCIGDIDFEWQIPVVKWWLKKKKNLKFKVSKEIIFWRIWLRWIIFCKKILYNKYKVNIYDLNKPKFKHKNLKYIKGNILDENKVFETIKKNSYVFNFAGWSDLETASNHEQEVKKLNLDANNKILKICKKKM